MQAFITNIIGFSKKNPIIMIYNDGVGAKSSRRTASSSFPIHLDPPNTGRMVYSFSDTHRLPVNLHHSTL